jgi:hypothetical protein
MQEFMKTLQAYQAKTDAILPAIQATQTSRKESTAAIKTNEVETMACQGMEARQIEEKPTSADTKPEAAQQEEVPVEDAEVIPVGEPKKKRRRDRILAAQHRRQKTNTSTRDNCGPQNRLAVTQRGRTPCNSGAKNANRPEDAPSRDSGTTHKRHLQAAHDPPCISCTTQEK